ncbi:uncharacterized protein [Argopecten irradians]|uniref:uncharacterized protein n=1 Tax=Argopecten irradians TaxID=31199 RepID=UPI003711D56B
MFLRPSNIRYSQDSIACYFSCGSHNGRPIGETLDDIISGQCTENDVPRMTVTRRNGHWYTGDNRRLWVFRKAEELGIIDYEIEVVKGWVNPSKFTTINDGVSIKVRGNPGGYVWKKMRTPKKITKRNPPAKTPDPQRSVYTGNPPAKTPDPQRSVYTGNPPAKTPDPQRSVYTVPSAVLPPKRSVILSPERAVHIDIPEPEANDSSAGRRSKNFQSPPIQYDNLSFTLTEGLTNGHNVPSEVEANVPSISGHALSVTRGDATSDKKVIDENDIVINIQSSTDTRRTNANTEPDHVYNHVTTRSCCSCISSHRRITVGSVVGILLVIAVFILTFYFTA